MNDQRISEKRTSQKKMVAICLCSALLIFYGVSGSLKTAEKKSLRDPTMQEASKSEQVDQDQKNIFPLSNFQIAAQGAKIEFIDRQLLVTSLPQKWAYAAAASLQSLPITSGPAIVTIRIRVLTGKMAFGVLTKDQENFIIEKAVNVGSEVQEIQLEVPALEEASSLIIRTHADDGQISRAIVERVWVANVERIIGGEDKSDSIKTIKCTYRFPDETFVLLHHLILKDYQQLEKENISDWEKVNLLREWAVENIDFEAEISKAVDAPSSPYHYYMWTAPEIFAFFLEDRGGTWCAGFAHALSTLYRMYGYRAYQVDMGAQNTGMTHVVTIVEINHNGKLVWSVQDSYFDETLVDSLGNPFNFLDLLKTLKKRNYHLIETQIGSSAPHDMFVAPELVPQLDKSYLSWYFYDLPDKPKPIKQLPDGRFKYKVKPKLEDLLKHETSGKPILDWLESEGHPRNMLYMYLYTFALYGDQDISTERESLLKKIKSIIND